MVALPCLASSRLPALVLLGLYLSNKSVEKMKSFVLASLIAGSAAFAPASQQRSSTSLNEFCNGYVGGESVEPMFIGETGSKNFDPLGLTEVGL